MNREILFRGKDLETGKWLYGSFIKTPNHTYISTNGEAFPAKVEPKTIGQYTGLTDKNGTKIFEGDVVKTMSFQDFCGTDKFDVQFVQGIFYVCHNGTVWTLRSCAESVKVIGNIYDNPVLLQENS